MKENLVSIIVPAYNCEKYISKCLESLINQTFSNIEIIIVNDGSIDKTFDLATKYAQEDKRIRIYTQENSGPSNARNMGITKSNGKYIAFVDSDDSVKENYLEELVKEIEDSDIVACGYTDISKYGIIELNDFYYGNKQIDKIEFIDNIFNGVGGTLWGKLLKRDLIMKNNINLDSNLYMCEDMVFILQYSMFCNKFSIIKDSLYNYNRLNESSISSKMNFSYYNNLVSVMTKIEEILLNNNFESTYVDKILTLRIQSLAINFAIMQHDKKHNYSLSEKLANLKLIFANRYFKRYKSRFITNNVREKALLILIKREKTQLVNFYSKVLFDLAKINNLAKNKRMS